MCLSGGKPGSAEVVNPVFSEMELKDIEFSLIDFNIFLLSIYLPCPNPICDKMYFQCYCMLEFCDLPFDFVGAYT